MTSPRRFASRAHTHRRGLRSRLRLEPLEDRRLLAVVTVTTEQDVIDFNDGVTSLREAVFVANTVPGPDAIVFDFGHDGPAVILLEQGELEITEAVTITGDGPDLLTIDAREQSRIFNITAETGDFTIAGMRLTSGKTTGDNDIDGDTFNGGVIRSVTTGSLRIENTTVTNSSTTGYWTAGGGVFAEGNVVVSSSTISGNSADFGGGIRAMGHVTVNASVISYNSTRLFGGGGVYVDGDATVSLTTISGNIADGGGGGIRSFGNVMLRSSTISGNSASGDGGGIFADFKVTITYSTISGNSAGCNGGGIYALGDATVDNSTISGNSLPGVGIACGGGGGINAAYLYLTVTSSTISANSGGIAASGAMITLRNSIVAGNTGDGTYPFRDLPHDELISAYHSLIGDDTGTGLTEAPVGSPDANGNLIGGPVNGIIDPMLAPLANNGGPTLTHALLPGSPAINSGDPTAIAGVGEVPLFDQRGEGFDRVVGGRIDMGAFEVQPLQADFDKDGDVDGADFLVWQTNFFTPSGATPNDGDADRDGDVDGEDFLIWQLEFAGGSGAGAGDAARSPNHSDRTVALDRLIPLPRRQDRSERLTNPKAFDQALTQLGLRRGRLL